MVVHIKLIKNNIKSSSSYGKYFTKTVSQGEVTLDEIAAEACRNSGFSEGAVVGVVTELQDILKQRLTEGQTVVLPGIGCNSSSRYLPLWLTPFLRSSETLKCVIVMRCLKVLFQKSVLSHRGCLAVKTCHSPSQQGYTTPICRRCASAAWR